MRTLWDFLTKPKRKPPPVPAAQPRNGPKPKASARPAAPGVETMEARYERITKEMTQKYGVRVRRWRTSMSGMAWEVVYHDGRVNRLIESPKPKGPMSAAIFLHEIGHHAIGFNVYRPRCLEEYHAWAFSLAAMADLGLNITDAVRRRMHDSLHYAIGKARRRGLRELPAELEPFTTPWPRPPRN